MGRFVEGSDRSQTTLFAYRLDGYVQAGLAAARDVHAEIFGLLGATEIQHRDVAEGAGHIIGTARMGSDPKSSVVDGDLRSHDYSNLFILGSAVFPTSATAKSHTDHCRAEPTCRRPGEGDIDAVSSISPPGRLACSNCERRPGPDQGYR
jgi:GMC oxidoreductase